jgi:hypothetical protein
MVSFPEGGNLGVVGWMKRSASTEYSIEGGTALLVPPYKTVPKVRITIKRIMII